MRRNFCGNFLDRPLHTDDRIKLGRLDCVALRRSDVVAYTRIHKFTRKIPGTCEKRKNPYSANDVHIVKYVFRGKQESTRSDTSEDFVDCVNDDSAGSKARRMQRAESSFTGRRS